MTASLLIAAALAGGCWPVEGGRIMARDLAQVIPAFRTLDPETDLGHAPAPGARRIFGVAELKRLARRHGLEEEPAAAACFERPLEPLGRDRLMEAMRRSLNRPEASIEIVEHSRQPTPRGEVEFPLSGLMRPHLPDASAPVLWRGHVRYGGDRLFRIWARVRVSVPLRRVVAVEDLPQGVPIAEKQVRLETSSGFPGGGPVLTSLEEAVGHVLRRPVRAGSPLGANLLQSPEAVSRGDLVRVEVLSGGARIVFEGRAMSGGSAGDQILVQNPASRKTFPAKVKAAGRVVAGQGGE